MNENIQQKYNAEKNDLDEIPLVENPFFMSSVRFSIMVILIRNKWIKFSDLQKLLSLTSGKLTHHLTKLKERRYIELRKVVFSTRFLTIIKITKKGKAEFLVYIDHLKTIIQKLD